MFLQISKSEVCLCKRNLFPPMFPGKTAQWWFLEPPANLADFASSGPVLWAEKPSSHLCLKSKQFTGMCERELTTSAGRGNKDSLIKTASTFRSAAHAILLLLKICVNYWLVHILYTSCENSRTPALNCSLNLEFDSCDFRTGIKCWNLSHPATGNQWSNWE